MSFIHNALGLPDWPLPPDANVCTADFTTIVFLTAGARDLFATEYCRLPAVFFF